MAPQILISLSEAITVRQSGSKLSPAPSLAEVTAQRRTALFITISSLTASLTMLCVFMSLYVYFMSQKSLMHVCVCLCVCVTEREAQFCA